MLWKCFKILHYKKEEWMKQECVSLLMVGNGKMRYVDYFLYICIFYIKLKVRVSRHKYLYSNYKIKKHYTKGLKEIWIQSGRDLECYPPKKDISTKLLKESAWVWIWVSIYWWVKETGGVLYRCLHLGFYVIWKVRGK